MSLDDLESIQLYLTKSQKREFKKACRQRQTTMSFELRRFIRAYISSPYVEERLYYAPIKSS